MGITCEGRASAGDRTAIVRRRMLPEKRLLWTSRRERLSATGKRTFRLGATVCSDSPFDALISAPICNNCDRLSRRRTSFCLRFQIRPGENVPLNSTGGCAGICLAKARSVLAREPVSRSEKGQNPARVSKPFHLVTNLRGSWQSGCWQGWAEPQ